MTDSKQSLFSTATSNFHKIPKNAWFLALLVGAVSSAIDVAYWKIGGKPGVFIVAWIIPAVFGWSAALYIGATGILDLAPTKNGCVRFVFTSLVMVSPIFATLGVLIFAATMFSQGYRMGLLSLSILFGLLTTSLLAAWPMANAVTGRIISPITILGATRGHRWSLLLLTLAAGGVGNGDFIPAMEKAQDIVQAVMIGLGNVLLGLIPFAFAASIAGAAWQFAVKNNPDLGSRTVPVSTPMA